MYFAPFTLNAHVTYDSIFLSPGENGDSALVINSDFWESHFLSGEKKTGAGFQPGPGLAQAGRSGEKKRVPQIGPDPGSGSTLAAQQKIPKHQETIGKTKDSGKCWNHGRHTNHKKP